MLFWPFIIVIWGLVAGIDLSFDGITLIGTKEDWISASWWGIAGIIIIEIIYFFSCLIIELEIRKQENISGGMITIVIEVFKKYVKTRLRVVIFGSWVIMGGAGYLCYFIYKSEIFFLLALVLFFVVFYFAGCLAVWWWRIAKLEIKVCGKRVEKTEINEVGDDNLKS